MKAMKFEFGASNPLNQVILGAYGQWVRTAFQQGAENAALVTRRYISQQCSHLAAGPAAPIAVQRVDTRQATGTHRTGITAQLPYSSDIGPGRPRTTHAPSIGPGPAPHRAAHTEPSVPTASAPPCCSVPNVVGEQFAQAESDVYSARLNPQEYYGAPANCTGRSIPKGTFIIGQQDPARGSALPPDSTVNLYFCDSSNSA
jgi:hypothetical protein